MVSDQGTLTAAGTPPSGSAAPGVADARPPAPVAGEAARPSRPRPVRARTVAVIARPEACAACGSCVEWCPRGAIEVGDVAVIDATLCIGCGACVDACPNKVIEMETRSA